MNRAEKEQVVTELRDGLGGAASIVLLDITGVDAEATNALRSNFRAKGVQCQVAKNTLIKRAIADTDIAVIDSLLKGQTTLVWHNEEPAVGAKIVKDFLKDNKELSLKGGYIDGELFEGEEAIKLAELPSKDELRAQLLGLMKMVPGKFLALLQTPSRQLLAVLENYRAKKEEAGE
jgi:large subunit ribosomal protein L10